MRTVYLAALALIAAGPALAQQEPTVIAGNQNGDIQGLRQDVVDMQAALAECQKLTDQAEVQDCVKKASGKQLQDFKADHQAQIDQAKDKIKNTAKELKDHQADLKAKKAACKEAADAESCLKQVQADDKAWWKARAEKAKAKAKELWNKNKQGIATAAGKAAGTVAGAANAIQQQNNK